MSEGSARPLIFISYSSADKSWLEYVVGHFRPAERNEVLKLWFDGKLNGGDELDDRIAEQLDNCDLCILLVSRYSLDSNYIMNIELERVRARNVPIFPIVVTRTTTWVVSWLDKKLLRPENGKPLQKLKKPARDDAMVNIVDEIVEITTPNVARNSSFMPPQEQRGAT